MSVIQHFFTVVLSILGHLPFHMKCRISLSMFIKQFAGILNGIIEPIDQVGMNQHLESIELSNPGTLIIFAFT